MTDKMDGPPTEPGWYWFDGMLDVGQSQDGTQWRRKIRICREFVMNRYGVLVSEFNGRHYEISRFNGDWYRATPPWEGDEND